MKTGLKGFTFALVGFIAPFVFVYNPAILLEGGREIPEGIMDAVITTTIALHDLKRRGNSRRSQNAPGQETPTVRLVCHCWLPFR